MKTNKLTGIVGAALLIVGILATIYFATRSTGYVAPSHEKYWINSNSNVRHNSDCKYYGNTRDGYYTDEEDGRACGICGG